MKLLIADDEMTIRKGLMSLKWESIGVTEMAEAANGLEAKEILAQGGVDVMVSDIKMPGLTGLELAQYVKEYSLDTKVILLTGFSDFEFAQEAIRSQVCDYILKPLRPKDILETVARVITTIQQKRQQEQVLRQYEAREGSSDAALQLQNCFPHVNRQMAEILTFMGKEYATDVSLNTLAEQWHFSNAYLSRMFRKETGFSFSDILTSIRLMNAAQMLLESREKIGTICEKTGFSDQRYFSQVFKKAFGCTPGDYKKLGKAVKLKTILDMMKQK